MLSTLDCLSSREIARFLRAESFSGFARADRRYFERFAHPALNPLAANGPMRFFLALEDGEIAGRILTFSDRNHIARTGRREGFFALLDARDGDAARALLARAEDEQRKWGNDILTGPVSPDGSGFFGGVSRGSARALFEGASSEAAWDALLGRGYEVIARFDSYAVRVPKTNPFRALAARAAERFQIEVASFSGFGARERTEGWIADCASPERRADVLREYGRIYAFLARGHSFAALRGGKCEGYLLALGSEKTGLRAATLETRPGAYTPPAALALLSALCDSLIARRVETVTASVVNSANAASARLVKRAGGSVKASFYEFSQKSLNNLTQK